MARGKKTGGRKKGTPNKITGTIKDEIEKVYQELGGTPAFHDWARKNKSSFYAGILPRIIPKELQHSGADGGPIQLRIVEKIVDGDHREDDQTPPGTS